ncbi:MAG: RluA family pseudouridine synthase [Pseudomonadota bacterium]
MTSDDPSLKPEAARPENGATAYAFAIADDAVGARLDKWLSDQIETLTRTRLKALIESGALEKDNAVFTDPSWKLRDGETLRLTVPAPADPAPKGEAIPLAVVFEDDDLIVVDKPAGMVVHPASGNWTGTLVNALIHHCGPSLSGVGGVARPGIVHRIDKDTSGLLVVAKNDRAHQGLAKLFSAHDIDRVYLAVAVGAPRPGVGTIDAALARAGGDRKQMSVVDEFVWDADAEDHAPRPGARRAVTHYKVIEAFGRSRAKLKGDALASLIECRLETGRTHQIRAHLSHIGCPLIGDPVYGRGPGLGGLKPGDEEADHAIAVIRKFRRQALHARVLGFVHPVTGETHRFESDPPADFEKLLGALKAL